MVKCVARRKFPAIGPKGCTFSSKAHKKSHEHKKPAPTPPASSPLNPPKKRITPQAVSSTASPAKAPASSFTDGRVLTKGQESYKQAILALEKKAAGYDKKYKRVLKR